MVTAAMKVRCLLLGRKSMTNQDSILKYRDISLLTKVCWLCVVKAMVFPVVMDGCESWTIKKAEVKNWCFWNCVVGEDCWESLGLHGDQTSQSKGNQSWIFIGRTDAKAETPILWPPDANNWLTEKDWCWERLKAEGEEDDRGWDGCMALLTR